MVVSVFQQLFSLEETSILFLLTMFPLKSIFGNFLLMYLMADSMLFSVRRAGRSLGSAQICNFMYSFIHQMLHINLHQKMLIFRSKRIIFILKNYFIQKRAGVYYGLQIKSCLTAETEHNYSGSSSC